MVAAAGRPLALLALTKPLDALALSNLGGPLARIGVALALVGQPLPVVGDALAVVGGALAGVRRSLSSVQLPFACSKRLLVAKALGVVLRWSVVR